MSHVDQDTKLGKLLDQILTGCGQTALIEMARSAAIVVAQEKVNVVGNRINVDGAAADEVVAFRARIAGAS